ASLLRLWMRRWRRTRFDELFQSLNLRVEDAVDGTGELVEAVFGKAADRVGELDLAAVLRRRDLPCHCAVNAQSLQRSQRAGKAKRLAGHRQHDDQMLNRAAGGESLAPTAARTGVERQIRSVS